MIKLEIIGKVNIEGSLKCEDLKCGEVFTFLDDNQPCMLCPDSYDTYIVNLATGDIEGTMEDFSERPVRRLKAKLVIEG